MKKIFLNTSQKIRSIWWIPIFFGLLVLFLLPTILIAQKNSTNVSMPLQAALVIVVTIICQLLRRESITIVTGTFNFSWVQQFIAGILLGALLMLLPAIILTLSGFVTWQVNDTSFSTIAAAIAMYVAVAVAEEFLFRGFLFQRLLESLGQWPAQIIIAGLFLLTHLNNPGMTGNIKVLASINIFIASILFGLAFIKTRSLAMPLGIHFMANFTQGPLLGFGVSGNSEAGILQPHITPAPLWLSGGNFGLEASLFGLLVLLTMTWLLFAWNPTKKKLPINTLKKIK